MSVFPISYYLVLSAILFGLGVVAFVFKRNIITIFMSIELMLNAVNLAFVAFARAHNQLDGLVFVFFVIVVAAAEAAVGLAIIIMLAQNRQSLNVERVESAQVLMLILDHLWIILALPLAGAAINGLLGKRWPKSAVNSVAVGSVSLAFLAVAELVREFCAAFRRARFPTSATTSPGSIAGPFRVDFSLQVDQLTVVMLLVVSFVGMLIHIYSTGYMAHEGGYYRFFSYLNLFMFFMLTLVLGREPHRDVRRMGRRGPVQLLADRLLVPEEVRGGRGQESLHHHAHRRFRLHRRHPAGVLDVRLRRISATIFKSVAANAGRTR